MSNTEPDPMLRDIRARLEEAADTLRRLPYPREYAGLRGEKIGMPDYVRNVWEHYGKDEARIPRMPPTAAAIDRLDEALTWLHWLEQADARLVFMRALRIGWKRVCAEHRMSRTTAWRVWTASLMEIARRKNQQIAA